MNNFERWQLYCRELAAPQSFIDFGFYFTIAAALQRRVWIGSSEDPLFPNNYTVLCGPPGVGKGITLNRINKVLRANKASAQEGIRDPSDLFSESAMSSPSGKKMAEANTVFFNEDIIKSFSKKDAIEKPLLFPFASQSTSWQALIKSFIDNMGAISIPKEGGGFKPYIHSSLILCLGELSNCFHKNSIDVVRMLVAVYDGSNYDYETISRKKDAIKNPCLSLIAGTTPEFMRSAYTNELASEGFNSRVWYIYEDENRFQRAFYPELTADQKIARDEFILHLRMLGKVKGQITFTQEAHKFIDLWWSNHSKILKSNTSPKLIHYYSRKQAHVEKLAMAVHFSEIKSIDDKMITKTSVKRAMDLLETAEKRMHLALNYKAANTLADIGYKILHILKNRICVNLNELHEATWEDLRRDQLEETVASLLAMGKIVSVKDEKTGNVKGYRIV